MGLLADVRTEAKLRQLIYENVVFAIPVTALIALLADTIDRPVGRTYLERFLGLLVSCVVMSVFMARSDFKKIKAKSEHGLTSEK